MRKIIKTLIVAVLAITVILSSCAKKQGGNPNSPEIYENPHVYTAPEVADERYILRNKEFLYTVVVPENITKRENIAKNEFIALLKRATGAVANVIVDTTITNYNPNGKYISIGQTSLIKKAGISINRDALKSNGVRIITKHDNIFLMGGVSDGAINAVYDFFNICFDYEWYGRNNIYINDKIDNLKLRNFDVVDIPKINTHQITYAPMAGSLDKPTELDKKALASPYLDDTDIEYDLKMRSVRNRYGGKSEYRYMFPASGIKNGKNSVGSQHNVLNIFSKETAEQNGWDWDDKWLSDAGNQICWTAHGDIDAYKRMIDFAVMRVIGYMKDYPPKSWPEMTKMMFGVEDGDKVCRCLGEHGCLETEANYGGYAGAAIRFCRLVHDKVRAWLDDPLNKEYYRPEFKIIFFANHGTTTPPVYKNDKGEWRADEGIFDGMNWLVGQGVFDGEAEQFRDRMFDNLVIWKNFTPSYFDVTSDNSETKQVVEEFTGWSAIIDDVQTWNYAEFFLNHSYFIDYLSLWNKNLIEFYDNIGVEHMLTELCGSAFDAVTAWGDLYFYMITKLSWSCEVSSEELISKFMKAHYGPAGDTMKNLYYAQKHHFQKIATEQYNNKGVNFNLSKSSWSKKLYPYNKIKEFIDYIDQAYKDIEDDKNLSSDKREVYKDRIDVEGISHYNALLEIYSEANPTPYTQEQKLIYKARAMDLLSRKKLKQLASEKFEAW